ncbi:hypothetical protein DFH09DRAFT_1082085 [Mycena vulgaris]|nr:hypothetical protein DFH09DRAFT_1082085 [Mycena vulgaris]
MLAESHLFALSRLLPLAKRMDDFARQLNRYRRLRNLLKTLVARSIFGVQKIVPPPISHQTAEGIARCFPLRSFEYRNSIHGIFRAELLNKSVECSDTLEVAGTYCDLAGESKHESNKEVGNKDGLGTGAREESIVPDGAQIQILNLTEEEEEEEDCLRGPKLKQQVAVLRTCDAYKYATDAKCRHRCEQTTTTYHTLLALLGKTYGQHTDGNPVVIVRGIVDIHRWQDQFSAGERLLRRKTPLY